MTVKELMDFLEDNCDPDDLVVLSRDEEGNGFSELWDISSTYSYNEGEIGLRELNNEMEEKGYSEEDVMEDGTPCVVLWP